MKRKLLSVGLATLSAFGFGLMTASQAHAVESCTSGELCLYYNSIENNLNAIFVQTASIADYDNNLGQPYRFVASNKGSLGAGMHVKNNAAYVENRSSHHAAIFYNSGYNCEIACQQILSLTAKNLNATMKNNNASGSL